MLEGLGVRDSMHCNVLIGIAQPSCLLFIIHELLILILRIFLTGYFKDIFNMLYLFFCSLRTVHFIFLLLSL